MDDNPEVNGVISDADIAEAAGEIGGYAYEITRESKECTLCERLAGLAGVLLGVALAAIALDLATGGKISSAVNRFRPVEVED